MTSTARFCVYVDWLAARLDDSVLAGIGVDDVPDGAESDTCIYWDEKRDDVLVLTWNVDAIDGAHARRLASDSVRRAVAPVVPGRLGEVMVYPVDDDDEDE